MNKTPVPASADTVAEALASNPGSPASPVAESKPRRGGRVAARDGGGTNGQAERRRLIREHLARQYYQGVRNPRLPFKGPEELAAAHDVTERTIRSDIQYLHDREHLPVSFIAERDGYGLTEEIKAFAGDEFTAGEFLTMWLSVHAFEAWGGLPHQKKLPTIMRKLKATSAALEPDHLKRLRQRITFKAGGYQAPVDEAVFDTVMGALLRQEELEFHYTSLTRRRDALLNQTEKGSLAPEPPELRCVQPLHLLCWEYAWYLFAWDPDRTDIRTFALGRMTDPVATGKPFEPHVKFNLRKELAKSFGITRGGKAVHVHLQFAPRALPLVIERLWHPSQEMVENEDGTLDLTLHLAVTPELVRWIQSWGADVQVLAPVSLDDQILAEARRHLEKAALRRSLTSDLSK